MARIAGVNLPNGKRIEIALTYIYGIGRSKAQGILRDAEVPPDTLAKDLTEQEIAQLRRQVEENVVEGDLRRKVYGDVQRLKDINAYRGIRHKRGLPVRGQRTKSNARTWKGARPAKAGKR